MGRGAVLQELLAVVARAQGGEGGSRWLVSEPGLGKTMLLDQLAERCPPTVRVVKVTGREAEADLAWGVFEQLVGPLVEDGLDDALAAPRRAAIRTTLGLEEGSTEDASPLATLVGARDLLLAAAADGGLVVVVDDLHWVDTPSRRTLDHLLGRLDGTPIAVILAGRPGPTPPSSVTPFHLQPLGETDAMALLRERGVLDPGTARRLFDELGGNPLLLHAAGDALDAHQREGRAPLPAILPIPPSVGQLAERQITALDPAAREALLVAAIASGGDLRTVTVALQDLGLGQPVDHPLARAEAAGVVQLGGTRVSFLHPTLRSAAYHLAAPSDRRRAHGAVARATTDEIVRAWHAGQASIGPDDEVAEALASAAGELLRRRAPSAAADHWERAATLTTDPQRAARWLRLGVDALSQTGRADAALALLDRADATAGDAGDPIEQVLRRRARLRLAARSQQPAQIVEGLRDLASAAEDLDPRRSAEIHLDCVPALIGGFRMGEIESAAKAALAQARRSGADDIERRAQMVLGGVLLARGELEGQALLDLYLEVLDHEGAVNAAPFLAEVAAPFLGVLRRGPEVDRLFEVLDRDLRAAVAIPALISVLGARAMLNHGRDLRRTIADDVEAIELADAIERPDLARFATGSLAVAAAVRGDGERTAWAAARCAASPEPAHHVAGLAGLAMLHLGRGELDDALALYETLYERHGIGASIVRWEPDWCEALVRGRQLGRAREMLDEFAGSPMGPLATGGVARARGMLADDDDAAVEQFEHVFRFLDLIPNDIVRGRTELVWGERLRRSRKRAEARPHLERAEQLLRDVGAHLWAERAARELVAAGAATADRHGTIGALTGQEREAVQLAIAGASNREIADRMFLSPRTVETHLSGAYRKLGVANRRELLIWASEGGTLED